MDLFDIGVEDLARATSMGRLELLVRMTADIQRQRKKNNRRCDECETCDGRCEDKKCE